MPRSAKPPTPGKKLHREFERFVEYGQQALTVKVPAVSTRAVPARGLRSWYEGQARRYLTKFASDLRNLRERFGLTEAHLAERAGVECAKLLSMEQGEPPQDSADVTRVCWALDVAGGIRRDEL